MADTEEHASLNINDFKVEELKQKLAELGLPVHGAKAVLYDRLRNHMFQLQETAAVGETSKSPNAEVLPTEKLENLSVKELKGRLARLGLKITGKKMDLINRLRTSLDGDDEILEEDEHEDEDEDEDEDEGGDEDEDEDEDEEEEKKDGGKHRRKRTGPMLTFKDVEDALETFSGDKGENVNRWFESFEKTASMRAWSNSQRIIYCKKLLRGSAKLFANFECSAQSWQKFKKALNKEFAKTVNSKQVHNQLCNVRKKSDETYQEYVYRVLEIASHADMELEVKIQYIIDGIMDDEVSKTILYSAKSIKDLRKKLLIYETQKHNQAKSSAKSSRNDKPRRLIQGQDPVKNKRCFNCGSKMHLSNECPDRPKGPKCFKCGEFGHVATKCHKDNKSPRTEKTRCDAVQSNDKKTYKDATLFGKKVTAMLDTGSDLNLVRASFYEKLGALLLEKRTIPFDSVGATNHRTLGRFKAEIIIDGLALTFDLDVVPDQFLGHDLLIGGELTEQAELRIRNKQASLSKIEKKSPLEEITDEGWRAVLNINVSHELNDKPDVSIQHIKNVEI